MTIGTNPTLGINDFEYRIIKYLYLKLYEVGIPAAQFAPRQEDEIHCNRLQGGGQMKRYPALNRSLAKAGAMIDRLMGSKEELDVVLNFKQVVVYLCIKDLDLPGRLLGMLLRYCYSIGHIVFRHGGVLTTGSTFPQGGILQQSPGLE
jgi:hypothetical protein